MNSRESHKNHDLRHELLTGAGAGANGEVTFPCPLEVGHEAAARQSDRKNADHFFLQCIITSMTEELAKWHEPKFYETTLTTDMLLDERRSVSYLEFQFILSLLFRVR